jgi:hypothetical protein
MRSREKSQREDYWVEDYLVEVAREVGDTGKLPLLEAPTA